MTFVDVALLAYYAVTTEPITTVAHVAALAMGTATERLAAWVEDQLIAGCEPGHRCCSSSRRHRRVPLPRVDSEEPMLSMPDGFGEREHASGGGGGEGGDDSRGDASGKGAAVGVVVGRRGDSDTGAALEN